MRYTRLLEGLDITVSSLSEICIDNEKFRIDPGYFSKFPVIINRRIEALPRLTLGAVCSVFRKGIFDIKASSYAEVGVPFVRIGNISNGLIDPKGVAFITPEAHAAECNTALEFGDIVLSKTAYAAAAFVNLSNCNVSQDTIAVKLSNYGRKQFKSGFIVAYLNSRDGIALMSRQFQGNVQEHLSLPDGRKIPVPLFDNALQAAIDQAVRDADKHLRLADEGMETAAASFAGALSLSQWNPPSYLTCVRKFSEVQAHERLDAEHYREEFYVATQRLKDTGARRFVPMDELLTSLTNGHTPLRHNLEDGEVPFLCAEHVTNFQISFDSEKRILLRHHQGELSRTALCDGDVLLTIKGRVGNAALVDRVTIPVNINQDVALLRLNSILPVWYVLAFINSAFGQLQVKQLATGAINPFLGLANVRRLDIPEFAPELMQQISNQTKKQVERARDAKAKAHRLLAQAKSAVEIAIEDSESAALKYLEER